MSGLHIESDWRFELWSWTFPGIGMSARQPRHLIAKTVVNIFDLTARKAVGVVDVSVFHRRADRFGYIPKTFKAPILLEIGDLKCLRGPVISRRSLSPEVLEATALAVWQGARWWDEFAEPKARG